MVEQEGPNVLSEQDRMDILRGTVRLEYIENGVPLDDLYKKYRIGRTTVFRWAKRGNWREERESFIASPEDEKELTVAERRDRQIKWLRSGSESLHIRGMQLLNSEADRATLPATDKNRFVDTVAGIRERTAMLRDLDVLRKAAFGEIIEVIEHDMIFEVEVNEQQPRVRIVQKGEARQVQPVIDIPAEEVEELGLVISPKHIIPPTNGEPEE